MFDITFYPMDAADREAIEAFLTNAGVRYRLRDGEVEALVRKVVIAEASKLGFAFEVLGERRRAAVPDAAPAPPPATNPAGRSFDQGVNELAPVGGVATFRGSAPFVARRVRITTADSAAATQLAAGLRSVADCVQRAEGRWLVVDVRSRLIRDALDLADAVLAEQRYDATVSATEGAAACLGLDADWPWTGEGETIAVIDSGCDTDHPSLIGASISATTRPGAVEGDTTGHGTHMIATICGRELEADGHGHGLAPRVALHSVGITQDDEFAVPLDLCGFLERLHAQGVRIFNLSWQSVSGDDYDWKDEEIDRFLHAHPDALVVVAAGNRRPVPLADNDWETTLTSPGTARNALCVGAVGTGRAPPGREAIESQRLASGSGIGPTVGNAVKPDLVAPGYYLRSARAAGVPDEEFAGVDGTRAWLGGTSQATAVTSACAALVRQKLRSDHGIPNPSGAVLKATLVASTRPVASDGPGTGVRVGYPDFVSGFGRIDLPRVLAGDAQLLVRDDASAVLASRDDATAKTHRFQFSVGENAAWLTVVLSWFDVPHPRLSSDLLLQVRPAGHRRRIGNQDHHWGRNPGSDGSVDRNNNVEITRWPAPPPGQWQLTVTAKHTGPEAQRYALALASDGALADLRMMD